MEHFQHSPCLDKNHGRFYFYLITVMVFIQFSKEWIEKENYISFVFRFACTVAGFLDGTQCKLDSKWVQTSVWLKMSPRIFLQLQ